MVASHHFSNEALIWYFWKILVYWSIIRSLFGETELLFIPEAIASYKGVFITCQTSKMELLTKIVNGFQQLTIFAKKLHLRCFIEFRICPCPTHDVKSYYHNVKHWSPNFRYKVKVLDIFKSVCNALKIEWMIPYSRQYQMM